MADPAARVPDDQVTDTLPADLDAVAAGYVGPYRFPDNSRRRWPGLIYLVSGAALVLAWVLAGRDPGQPATYLNRGMAIGGAVLVAIGIVHLAIAWPTRIDQTEALAIAARTVGRPLGHAATQMAWRGVWSRPTWRVLAYSPEDPPRTRVLVLLDAVDGRVLDTIVEDNPEDWSGSDGGRTAPRRPGE